MLELRILVDDIDYDSIAEYLIPAVAEKLRREEKGGILGNVLAGNPDMAASVARTVLGTMSQEQKDQLLVQLVTECISRNGYSLRRNILQEMGNRLKLYGYVYDGYAAHISTLQNYYDRSMELLDTGVRGRLFCPERPVYGKENDSPSSYIDPEGGCVNSLVADGCDIQGSVKNCVLFRNVRIEKGASVENCILFKDTVVKRGAVLRGVITDKYVTISENVTLMGHERYPIVIAKGATV